MIQRKGGISAIIHIRRVKLGTTLAVVIRNSDDFDDELSREEQALYTFRASARRWQGCEG
jgi:hypothetical protein